MICTTDIHKYHTSENHNQSDNQSKCSTGGINEFEEGKPDINQAKDEGHKTKKENYKTK